MAVAYAVVLGLWVAPAQAAVLYDQTETPIDGQIGSTDFDSPNSSFDMESADDFTVPAGEVWTIDRVFARGYSFGPRTAPPPPSARVRLYTSGDGAPGVELFSQNVPVTSANTDLDLPVTGAPPLAPGHYWLSVQATGVFAYGAPDGWAWRFRNPVSGDAAVFRRPHGGPSSCNAWAPANQCGSAHDPVDFLFELQGTDGRPESTACTDTAGCWHFDEEQGATTATDASGNDNNGTYVNGPLLGVSGVFNTAVSMDGRDDHVKVPDAPSLDTGDSFSLVGWIKRDDDGHTHQLFNKGGKGYHLVVMSRFEGNQVWLRKAGSSTIVRSDGGVLADKAWHQVVATKDGPGSAQLYIDGEPQDEQVVSGAQVIQNTTFPLYFSSTPSGNVVAGDLDEFAVYDRALTPAEIAASYQAGALGDSIAARTTAVSRTPARTRTLRTTTTTGCAGAGTTTSGITAVQAVGIPCGVATAAAYTGPAAVAALGVSCAITGEDFGGAVTRISHRCTGPLGVRLTYTSLS